MRIKVKWWISSIYNIVHFLYALDLLRYRIFSRITSNSIYYVQRTWRLRKAWNPAVITARKTCEGLYFYRIQLNNRYTLIFDAFFIFSSCILRYIRKKIRTRFDIEYFILLFIYLGYKVHCTKIKRMMSDLILYDVMDKLSNCSGICKKMLVDKPASKIKVHIYINYSFLYQLFNRYSLILKSYHLLVRYFSVLLNKIQIMIFNFVCVYSS